MVNESEGNKEAILKEQARRIAAYHMDTELIRTMAEERSKQIRDEAKAHAYYDLITDLGNHIEKGANWTVMV